MVEMRHLEDIIDTYGLIKFLNIQIGLILILEDPLVKKESFLDSNWLLHLFLDLFESTSLKKE